MYKAKMWKWKDNIEVGKIISMKTDYWWQWLQ